MLKKITMTMMATAMLAACGQQNSAQVQATEAQNGVIGGDVVSAGTIVGNQDLAYRRI